jgi:hypothetical protein
MATAARVAILRFPADLPVEFLADLPVEFLADQPVEPAP